MTHSANNERSAGRPAGSGSESPLSKSEYPHWLGDVDPFLRDLIKRFVHPDLYPEVARTTPPDRKTFYLRDLSRLFEAINDEEVSEVSQLFFDDYIAEMVVDKDPDCRQFLAQQLRPQVAETTRLKLTSSLIKHMFETVTRDRYEAAGIGALDSTARWLLMKEESQQTLVRQLTDYDRADYPNPEAVHLLFSYLPRLEQLLKGTEDVQAKEQVRGRLLLRLDDAETRLRALQTYGQRGRFEEAGLMTAILERYLHDKDADVRSEAQMILLEYYLHSPEDSEEQAEIDHAKLFDWLSASPVDARVAAYARLAGSAQLETRVLMAGSVNLLVAHRDLIPTLIEMVSDVEEVTMELREHLLDLPSGRSKTALFREIARRSDNRELKIELLKGVHTSESWLAPEIFMALAEDKDEVVRAELERCLHRLGETDRRQIEEVLASHPPSLRPYHVDR